eukprot:CAMPEP_0181124788 /NCGR_PEP_ID=MMETSP1071-20121207/26678_1 /TAXON_ID=35127 /ORGANISM="Thalassiosira sp., Strain NH16" /LENGTH=306 /DNA_ID=CAMNT_0023210137 /DNA_START=136 /DNA_END=1057 /DNA_ORIENTATION=-
MAIPSSTKSDKPMSNVPASVADVSAAKTQTKFRWKKVIELGYIESEAGNAANVENEEPVCFHCGKIANESESSKLSKCARCQVARIARGNAKRAGMLSLWKDCERIGIVEAFEMRSLSSSLVLVSNWKGGDGKVGHKFSCAAYKRVGDDMMIVFGDDKDSARQDILSRIRFYAYPYAVHKSQSTGRGLLFVQSDSSLAVLSLPTPILSNGRRMTKQRSVLLHWLTMQEFGSEVCMDDFELASVRNELKEAVETYDKKVEVPVLMRFRCGHVAVGIAPLVPDFKLCTVLGNEYGQGDGALQLNIDDM